MKSTSTIVNTINLPLIDGEFSMISFDLQSLEGLPTEFKEIVQNMVKGVKGLVGEAYFTIHGKLLSKNDTLRRGGPHTDGSYDKQTYSWGGGSGWKVGENGPPVGSEPHTKLYAAETGGLILTSNFESCLGWEGEYEGAPAIGGDCKDIELDEPFMLEANKVYYGNNHFIHESLPVSEDVHRVFARITLPEDHVYAH